MSYWIRLEDRVLPEPVTVQVPTHIGGGTYAAFGTDQASLSVTYNYARWFRFRRLHDRRASDTVPELEQAVAELGTEQNADYWAPTPGNAGRALATLLSWARQHPNAYWTVS